MCFGGGGGGGSLQQLLALQAMQQQQAAAKAQSDAAASIANANLDTESSRRAAEQRLRAASNAQGFMSTILGGARGGAGNPASPITKMLFGQ